MTKVKTRATSGANTPAGQLVSKVQGKKAAYSGGSAGRRKKTPAFIPVSTMLVREEEAAEARIKRKGSARAVETAAVDTDSTAAPRGKLGEMIALMHRPGGASFAELMSATAWQAHSVRGAISGAVKKKLGLTVETVITDGVRRWRIVT